MKDTKVFHGDVKEFELSKEELKQLEIDQQLETYKKVLNNSKSPYILLGYFLGINSMVWLLYSFSSNPKRIVPMYDGFFSVVFDHLFFVLNQVFFLYILPFGVLLTIITIVFSKLPLPSTSALKKKLELGENIIDEAARKIQYRGKIKRIAVIALFIIISVITLFSITFRLDEVFIYDESDLHALTIADSGKRIILMNDITVEESSRGLFYEFTGVFDGNGYTISGIEVSKSLFGENYGVISNVRFENVTCIGYQNISFLTSYNYGTISNVSVDTINIYQEEANKRITWGSMSVLSMVNTGVIQDVSLSNLEYTLLATNTGNETFFELSGITMENEGKIVNAYMTPYIVENYGNIRRNCLVTCLPSILYIPHPNPSEGIIQNVKVDILLLNPDIYNLNDDDFITCLGCIDDFDIENQMVQVPKTYWQIKYPEIDDMILVDE